MTINERRLWFKSIMSESVAKNLSRLAPCCSLGTMTMPPPWQKQRVPSDSQSYLARDEHPVRRLGSRQAPEVQSSNL